MNSLNLNLHKANHNKKKYKTKLMNKKNDIIMI